jgi:hypothetical protein
MAAATSMIMDIRRMNGKIRGQRMEAANTPHPVKNPAMELQIKNGMLSLM